MSDQLLDQPVAAEHLTKASGPTPWEILWYYKSYVALGAVIGIVLGVLYWSMAKRVYETTAQIWVVKKQPDVPISSDPQSAAAHGYNASEDFLSTHRTLIQSAVIVGDAISKGRLGERAVFRGSNRPAYDLARALIVTRDRDKTSGSGTNSQVLNITFRCSHSEDCAPVLSAVIASYREFLDNKTQDSSKQTLELIEQARKVLFEDLEQKEAAHDKFLRDTPILWKSQYGTTVYQERLASLDAQRTGLKAQLARLQGTFDAVNKAIKEGRSQADLLELLNSSPAQMQTMSPRMLGSMPMMDSTAARSPSILSSSLEQELIALQLEEGKMLEDFGPNHQRVKSVRDRMATIRAMLAPAGTPEGQSVELRDRQVRAKEHLVALRLSQLKQDLQDTVRTLKSMDSLFDKEMADARKAFPIEAQEASFRRAIERSQLLYDTITQRLKELNVVSTSRGFETQVITPPTDAEKVSPKGSMVFPLAVFLGLLLGGGLAYLAEYTDKSFRSTEDIRRRLGLQIMGIIPLVKQDAKEAIIIEEGEEQPAPSLFTWHRRASKEAEAYRGVRTALYFSTHGQGRKVIQVTSPNKGDGKSTLAANLAVSIAQSGKSCLLVDADLRRPQVGKLFNVKRPVGFASVLGGLSEPNEVIVPTVIPNLSIIPAGPTPPNPAELLTGMRLHEVLEWLRERYDYVIVDSPPLLAVTDPGVVGPQVDGVVMALRPTKRSRVEAKRAKEILDNLGINVFGVVVNAIDQSSQQAGYGYYGYYGYYRYYNDYHENDTPSQRNGEERHSRGEKVGRGVKR